MLVHELIDLLQGCNQMAKVHVSINERIGDYTWAESDKAVVGILPWPEPKEAANHIELIIK